MTTVLLIVACFVIGPLCIASSRRVVRVAGWTAAAVGGFLWFGLDALCGSGPLMNCVVVQ